MNVKSMVFVGFILVSVTLLMGLKDETHPKWEYGQLKVHRLVKYHHTTVRWMSNKGNFEFEYIPPIEVEDFSGEFSERNVEQVQSFLKLLGYPGYEDVSILHVSHEFKGDGVVFLMNMLGSRGWELSSNEYILTNNKLQIIYTYTFKRRIQ